MIYYVAHSCMQNADNLKKARQITHDLQIADTENCYVCPLMAFSHLEYDEIPRDTKFELCIDLLSVSDKLIVASEVSEGVQREIDFANLFGMEVEYLEGNA